MMWCLAIGQELIPECCFSIIPDDDDLNRYKTNTCHDYILPTLKQVAALPANVNDMVDVLCQLGATMARSSKAAKAQNATQCKQLNYMKEKDKKKKDKAEKWHGLSYCLILNVASTNGQHPTDEVPESYQTIINESIALADKGLHCQMVTKGPIMSVLCMAQQQASSTAASAGMDVINQATYHFSLSMKTTPFLMPKHRTTLASTSSRQ
jgi:hypothetical protein